MTEFKIGELTVLLTDEQITELHRELSAHVFRNIVVSAPTTTSGSIYYTGALTNTSIKFNDY